MLSCVLFGTIMTGGIGLLFGNGLYGNAGLLRLYQFISAIFTFLLPALLLAWFCSRRMSGYLSLDRIPNAKVILLTIISMFLFSPVITMTGVLNKMMKLPAFLEPVERWMQSMEASAEELTNLLLSQTDIFSILANLVVIAAMAAITEEFFFRGAIQTIIGKWTRNAHLVIWLAAFLFSALHLQFYGFAPRLLLGAYFGYLLLWSRSLWLPVLAHFVNNAVAVIGMSNTAWKDNEFISGDIPESDLWAYALVAAVALVLFFYCVKSLRRAAGC